MSRAPGGAARAVNVRASGSWFNPDDYDEATMYGTGAPSPSKAKAAPQANSRYDQLMGHAAAHNGAGAGAGAGGGAASMGRTMGRAPSLTRNGGHAAPEPDPPFGGGGFGGFGDRASPSGVSLRRQGSGALGGTLGGTLGGGGMGMGGLSPPPAAQVPDRPGTCTTTSTVTDSRGLTTTTKTTVTRTHSGRIRTAVETSHSGPAHIIAQLRDQEARGGGSGGGGGGWEEAISPTRRLSTGGPGGGAAPWGGRTGGPGSADGSPMAPGSPVTPPGMRRAGPGATLAGPGSSLLASATATGRVSSSGSGANPLRTSMSGGVPLLGGGGGGAGGSGSTGVSPRLSQTGMLPSARPGSASRDRPIGTPPGVGGGGGTLRSSWADSLSPPGAGGAAAAAARGPAVAAKPLGSSPAAAAAGSGGGGGGVMGSPASAGSGRAPSAGRMPMSVAFASAHGLGNTLGGSGGGGGGGGGGFTLPSPGRASAASPEPLSPSPDKRFRASVDASSPPLLSRTSFGGGGPGVTASQGAAKPAAQVGRSPSLTPVRSVEAKPATPVAVAKPVAAVAAVKPAAAATAVAVKPAAAAAAKPAAASPAAAKPAAAVAAKPAPAAAAKPAASPAAAAAAKPAAPVAAKPAAAAPAAKPAAPAAKPAAPAPAERKVEHPPGVDLDKLSSNMGKFKAVAKMYATRRNAGMCAVSLAFLRRFRAKLLQERPRDAHLLSTSQVTQEVIKPMTLRHACRLTDLPELAGQGGLMGEADVGSPAYFISHAWSMGFLHLLDCIFNHLQGALDSTRVWLDIFAVNQHPGAEQKDDLDNLKTAIRLSQATLVMLDAAGTPLERVWCLYEFDNTITIKGADALVLLTPGFSVREIASIFRSIDVDAAKATVLSDKAMILDDIRAKHGSTTAFNAKLKLRFLLDPLDSKPDLLALAARAGSDPGVWDLGPVAQWLAQPAAPQIALLTAGPGTGKSTISAVLCMGPEAAAEAAAAAEAGEAPNRPSTAAPRRPSAAGAGARPATPGKGGVAVHAYHFCKYSDARRQDPVRVVKTLAYQLAHALPALQPYYCALDPGTLMQLNQPDAAARELLLIPLQQYARGQQVLLVLDALDEADKAPPPSHAGGPATLSAPSALDNKVLQLLLHQLSLLPSCVRILATARPDKHLTEPLRSRFPRLLELGPGQLRRSDKTQAAMQSRLVERFGDATARALLAAGGAGAGGEAPLVYFPVVALLRAPLEAGGVPAGLGAAYAAVFAQQWPGGKDAAMGQQVQQLLCVLVAAQEPPPMSLLAALGLQRALYAAPGWGCLLFERDHSVHVLHRTLIEWLQDRRAAGPRFADARVGHSLLGKHLLAARPVSVYGARYLVTHLIKAGSDTALLDKALQDLSYLEAACRQGDVFKLHAELASLPEAQASRVVTDVVRWLGLNGGVLWSHPGAVGQLAAEAPRNSAVWQVGARAPSKPTAQLLNAPPGWPLEVMALTQHRGAVADAAYSPDGSLLVSASLDGTVRLWDAGSGEPKAALSCPPALAACISPTGHLLATGCEGGAVALWDPATGVQRAEMRGHRGDVAAVALSVDGGLLASGGKDKVIRLWATYNGSQRAELKGHSGPLLLLAFSPDGSQLASAAAGDTVVRLWNASAGSLQIALEGHRAPPLALAYSPDGSSLVTASDCVRFWDAATGMPKGALTDHIFPVAALAWAPDGKTLVSADTAHTLRLWAVGPGGGGGAARSPTPKGRGPPGMGGPPPGVKPAGVMETESAGQLSAMALSRDGRMVATGSAAGELHIFALGGGAITTVRAAHAGQIRRLAFSPDSRGLVSASDDCTLRLWEPRSALKQGAGEGGQAHGGAVTFSAHFCQGGRAVACVGEDGALSLWDAGSGQLVAAPQRAGGGTEPRVGRMSPDGATLAVGEKDGNVRLWELASGKLRARLKGHTDSITDLAFSPDGGSALASASEDCRIRLWAVASGQQTALLTGHTATVCSVAFAPGGAVVASGGEDGGIRLWATSGPAVGRSSATLAGHRSSVLRLAFSPDGRLLASGSSDCTVRLWDAGSGAAVAVLQGHKEQVTRLAWAPSGRLLASGSRGSGAAGSVFVWPAGGAKEPLHAVHAAYMAAEDCACPGGGALCTVVSALEHAPHLTLVTEAGAKGGPASGGEGVSEAGGGALRLRQVPVYTSFAAPAALAVHSGAIVMAFGASVFFYRY